MKIPIRKMFLVVMALLALLVVLYLVPSTELPTAGRYVLAVFVLAVGLWVSTPQELLTPASLLVLILTILALSADPSTVQRALATGMSGYGMPVSG